MKNSCIEIWKSVVDYPDYEVSSCGRVRRITVNPFKPNRPVPYFMKALPSPSGYLRVHLSGNKTHSTLPVHALVLKAFVGPRAKGAVCRHLDGDKTNNNLGNLAWGTIFDNASDKVRHGKDPKGERNPRAKLTEAQVLDIRQKAPFFKHGDQSKIARMLGVSPHTINQVVHGINWA